MTNTAKSINLLTVLCILILNCIINGTVIAQENDARELEEIIVTTERREINYQDLGGTAISFSGDDLKLQGILNLTDLAENVVGLEIGNNQGNVEVWIRGVGSSNNTELGDPAAATHYDGIYVPRPSGIGSAFFDIRTVEVNIGPQGTLRGRNATAGSVNIIPWHPGLDNFDLAFEVEGLGNYNQEMYTGVINLPILDNLATRFAIYKLQHDSYYNDVSPVNKIGAPEAEDNFGARWSVLYEPIDKLTVLFSADYMTEKGTGYTGTNFANPLGNNIDPYSIDDPRDVWMRGFEPIQDTRHQGAKLQFTYDLGFADLEYTAGARDLIYDYAAATPLGPDYTNAEFRYSSKGGASVTDNPDDNIVSMAEARDNFSRFQFITESLGITHEIRLVSPDDENFFYSLGLFHFIEKQHTFLGTTGDRSGFFQGVEFNQPNTDTESTSLYADMTWKFNDERTRFTTGLRYTDDHKERVGVNAQYGFLLFGFNKEDPNDNFDCCVGLRIGTEGFEFSGPDRQVMNPDLDGIGGVSPDEFIGFYLDGIKRFGARDTMDEFLYAFLDDKSVYSQFHDINLLDTLYPSITDMPCSDFDTSDGIICDEDGFYSSQSRIASLADGTTTNITPQDGEINDNFLDWRIRVEHDLTVDNMAYFLLATGHKSGGFNDNFDPATGISVLPTYDTEKVTMYEIGSKNEFDFFDIPTRLNASAFFYDYTNQVFTAILSVNQAANIADGLEAGDIESTDASLGVSYSFNAADSEIYGAQLEGQFLFENDFTVKWSFLWLEAQINKAQKIQDFRFQADIPEVQETEGKDLNRSIDGKRLPHTPEYQFNISLSQQFDVGSIGSVDYIVSAGWRDDQFKTIFNSQDYNPPETGPRQRLNDRVESYWTFDAGMGLNHLDSNLRLEAYINNITNEVRPAALIISQFDNTRFFTRPRTFGFRAKWQL
jgi:iron complex outermembrane recepter protein